jgi:CubicO group peptidase (beta-lactamase class C family)
MGAQTDASQIADNDGKVPAEALANIAAAFMAACDVPGMSVAIASHERMVYQRAFGLGDVEKKEPVTEASRFRIASVSKPITSAAVFSLIEQQKLSLEARVFGQDAVLGNAYGKPPFNPGVDQITVEHLLTHTCGGWGKGQTDPMFQNPELSHKDLISRALKTRRLEFAPGSHYAYSNFGFCVLGRVIEKVTGLHYADYVREQILRPCGVTGMQIGGNTLGKRAPDEVRYYDQEGGDPYGMNVSRLDSAGGWIATPAEIVRFAARVDGFAGDANILKPETIKSMTTGSTANPRYAKGWEVNEQGRWWHIGDLPGSSSVLLRTPTGYCAAAFMNTRRLKPDIRILLERAMVDMVRQISERGGGLRDLAAPLTQRRADILQCHDKRHLLTGAFGKAEGEVEFPRLV